MSVRRLAEISVQPPAFAFSDENSSWAEAYVKNFPLGRQQSAVIPLLMRAQEQEGWVTKAAIEAVADMLKMPYIRALEVATFYTQFQLKPVGARAHVQVCGTTPCMLRGSEALMDVCREKIHHDQFHVNAGGTLSWEEVECLGACVNAPMVMIFKDTYEDLTPERLGEIIDAFERGAGGSVPVGPQNGRVVSVPASGQTTLLDESIFIEEAKARRDKTSQGRTDGSAELSGEGTTPPSKGAKPATDAVETNKAVKSPSGEKSNPAAEGAAPSEVPPHDAAAADKGEPSVEGEAKERHRPIEATGEPAPYRAPELQQRPPAAASGPMRERQAAGSAADAAKPGAGESGSAPPSGSGVPPDAALEPIAEKPVPVDPEITKDLVADAEGPSLAEEAGDPTKPGNESAVSVGVQGGGAGTAPAAESPASDTQEVAGTPSEHPDRPAAIERPAQPDDLKLISGVGPKTEATLHGLGVYTFAQIAAWSGTERHWVDGYLKFHGRIERDEWVRQAKALADGGEEEYFRQFGKKPR